MKLFRTSAALALGLWTFSVVGCSAALGGEAVGETSQSIQFSPPTVLRTATLVEVNYGAIHPFLAETLPRFYSDFANSGYAQSLSEYATGTNVTFAGSYTLQESAPPVVLKGDLSAAL